MKFTIIVPIYNCQEYIQDTIASILNNKLPENHSIQVIAVDDGSTDSSIKLVDEFKDHRIEVIKKKNGSWGSVINYVVNNVKITGDFVTIVNGGDVMAANAIQSVFNNIISTKADLVLGNFNIVDTSGYKIIKVANNNRILYTPESGLTPFANPLGKFYNRELFLKLRNINLTEKEEFVDGILYNYLRQHATKITIMNHILGNSRLSINDSHRYLTWDKKIVTEYFNYLNTITKYDATNIAYRLASYGHKKSKGLDVQLELFKLPEVGPNMFQIKPIFRPLVNGLNAISIKRKIIK